ncbi:unnamed protein product [Arctia plantaginis]|uniref:Uncharacterized protein n=1 Tax=Arctia plantaginis TaxID=874455 RepID=A0A8S1B0G1_ARCPL|nr:unnamed protein product [Arctia plantaginis]
MKISSRPSLVVFTVPEAEEAAMLSKKRRAARAVTTLSNARAMRSPAEIFGVNIHYDADYKARQPFMGFSMKEMA